MKQSVLITVGPVQYQTRTNQAIAEIVRSHGRAIRVNNVMCVCNGMRILFTEVCQE